LHYFIDGYNLLFSLMPGDRVDLQAERKQLLEHLQEKVALAGLNVTVVFDARTELLWRRQHIGELEIVFTDQSICADRWILQKLERVRTPATYEVVSNDRELLRRSRWAGARTQSVAAWMKWLTKKAHKRTPPPTIIKKERGVLLTPEERENERWLRLFEERLNNWTMDELD
jgi:predicted RNA-binding protein with PIN domain